MNKFNMFITAVCVLFLIKTIKVLESVKLKQQEVSSEVLVTAIDVKCNFTEQINANQGKMHSDRAPGGGTGN